MKNVKILLLISIFVFNSCTKEETTAPNGTSPQAPTLSSPSNGATNQSTSPTLSWNASSGATSYTLQVSTDSLFSSYVYNQSGLTSISQQVTGLSNSTLYYWWVNAANGYGTSIWSTPTWSFMTASLVFICGSTVDYSGKTYNTVKIGNQCWLKENIDVGTMIQGTDTAKNNGIIEKYCYNNDTNNCNTYGALYQWNEAMQYSNTQGSQGICPTGWHIPTNAEFDTLASTVGGDANVLKAVGQGTGAGSGTNASGFSALLAGYQLGNASFIALEGNAMFWRSTELNTNIAYGTYLYYNNSNIVFNDNDKDYGFSVRCIKD
jgi:uncharacterized protein (TIGR02145 family)